MSISSIQATYVDTYSDLALHVQDLEEINDEELAERVRSVMDFIWRHRLSVEALKWVDPARRMTPGGYRGEETR